jgi:hypothetical protein
MSISDIIPQGNMFMAAELRKLANLPEPPPDFGEVSQEEVKDKPQDIKHPILHALKAVMAPAAAFGAGTVAGALAGRGVTHGLGLSPSSAPVLRKAAPFLGGGLALAMQQYHSRASKELNRAHEAYKSQSARAVPAE